MTKFSSALLLVAEAAASGYGGGSESIARYGPTREYGGYQHDRVWGHGHYEPGDIERFDGHHAEIYGADDLAWGPNGFANAHAHNDATHNWDDQGDGYVCHACGGHGCTLCGGYGHEHKGRMFGYHGHNLKMGFGVGHTHAYLGKKPRSSYNRYKHGVGGRYTQRWTNGYVADTDSDTERDTVLPTDGLNTMDTDTETQAQRVQSLVTVLAPMLLSHNCMILQTLTVTNQSSRKKSMMTTTSQSTTSTSQNTMTTRSHTREVLDITLDTKSHTTREPDMLVRPSLEASVTLTREARDSMTNLSTEETNSMLISPEATVPAVDMPIQSERDMLIKWSLVMDLETTPHSMEKFTDTTLASLTM